MQHTDETPLRLAPTASGWPRGNDQAVHVWDLSAGPPVAVRMPGDPALDQWRRLVGEQPANA